MGFFSDLLFGGETGTAPGTQEATQRAMQYQPGTVQSDYTTGQMGRAEQAFGLGGAGGAGMDYLQNMLTQDPFSSQAFQQTQQAMSGILDERLTGLGSQLGGAWKLRGSGQERLGAQAIRGSMRDLGTMSLQAGLQSEQMRSQAAQFLPQMQMDQGRGFMGLGQMQTGMQQADISNRMAALGLNLQGAQVGQGIRESGQQRQGGLFNLGMDVLGGIAGLRRPKPIEEIPK